MIKKPIRIDFKPEQAIADMLREAEAQMRQTNENAARLFGVASDLIESMCDALKAQQDLVDDLIDEINKGAL